MKRGKMLKAASYHVKAIDDETGAEIDLGTFEIRTKMPRFNHKTGNFACDVTLRGFSIVKLKLRRFVLGFESVILTGMIKLLEVTK